MESSKKVPAQKAHRFVIHEHTASRLHFDLRLEYNRKLLSWALPKKPSSQKGVKRLAIEQPDHPISYIDFEGTIPEGTYGAGTVKIWDSGTYTLIKRNQGKLVPLKKCLHDGQIELWIEGTHLKGAYALIKTDLQSKDEWLFMKINDTTYNLNQ